MRFNDFLNQVVNESINSGSEPAEERKPTRAERIRSYMDDSGMSRKQATAMVDFEDGK